MLSVVAVLGCSFGSLLTSCGGSAANSAIHTQTIDVALATPQVDISKWVAPTVLGIKVGESTEKDVHKLFGKPDDEYPNRAEDKVFEKDVEDEVVQDYRTLKDANGQLVVILGKKSRVVKAVSLYPNATISLNEVISKYGEIFVQMEYSDSYCVKDGRKSGVVDVAMTYPFVLVYPSLGMAIDIRNYGKGIYVGRFDYMMKCG
jgi:hypothetical protein